SVARDDGLGHEGHAGGFDQAGDARTAGRDGLRTAAHHRAAGDAAQLHVLAAADADQAAGVSAEEQELVGEAAIAADDAADGRAAGRHELRAELDVGAGDRTARDLLLGVDAAHELADAAAADELDAKVAGDCGATVGATAEDRLRAPLLDQAAGGAAAGGDDL